MDRLLNPALHLWIRLGCTGMSTATEENPLLGSAAGELPSLILETLGYSTPLEVRAASQTKEMSILFYSLGVPWGERGKLGFGHRTKGAVCSYFLMRR